MNKQERRQYDIDRYHRRMDAMRQHLGGQCRVCGSKEKLEIDHIDPSQKTFKLSGCWTKPWTEILSELSKCQLLCKKHHQERTATTHGRIRMYQNGCKCELCMEASRNYTRQYRKKNGRRH